MSSSNISEADLMEIDDVEEQTHEEFSSDDDCMEDEEEKPVPSKTLTPTSLKLNLKPSPQCFSFPSTIIYYIAKKANNCVATKLLQSCKTLYLLVHKNQDYEIKQIHGSNINGYEYVVAAKSIKITDTLDLMFLPEKTMEILYKKLDVTSVETVQFFSCFSVFPLKYFDFVLQPSAKVFWVTAHFDTPISPTLKAFEVLQNAKEIYLTCVYNALTKTDFKKLLQIKRNSKLKVCGLAVNCDVDKEDIIQFLDTHMLACSEPCSRLTLCLRGENQALKTYVNEILEERRKTSSEVPEVKIEFRKI